MKVMELFVRGSYDGRLLNEKFKVNVHGSDDWTKEDTDFFLAFAEEYILGLQITSDDYETDVQGGARRIVRKVNDETKENDGIVYDEEDLIPLLEKDLHSFDINYDEEKEELTLDIEIYS